VRPEIDPPGFLSDPKGPGMVGKEGRGNGGTLLRSDDVRITPLHAYKTEPAGAKLHADPVYFQQFLPGIKEHLRANYNFIILIKNLAVNKNCRIRRPLHFVMLII
jgi:hypothetical protein